MTLFEVGCIRGTDSISSYDKQCDMLVVLLSLFLDLKDDHVMAVDWSKCKHMMELDISCTDLSENTLMELFSKLPALKYIAVGHCDFFTDKVWSGYPPPFLP